MQELDSYIQQEREYWQNMPQSEFDAHFQQLAIRREKMLQQKKGPPSSIGERILVTPHGPPNWVEQCGKYMHQHNCFEFSYVYRGEFFNTMPDQTIHMKQGSMIFLNPNILHSPYVLHFEDAIFNVRIGYERIKKSIIPMLKNNHLFITFFMDYLYRDCKNQKFIYFDSPSPASIHYMECLIREGLQKRDFQDSAMDALLTLLFTSLAREYNSEHSLSTGGEASESGELSNGHMDSLAYDMIAYISEHYADVTLEELSQKFQYSAGHISRILRQQTGKSFTYFVYSHRMSHAATYLTTTSLPVGEIGAMVGFSSASRFNISFKQQFSCSPTQYRKKFSQRSNT